MPGQTGTEKRQKSAVLTVRMYPDLYRRIEAEADSRGLSVASFMRDVAMDAVDLDEDFEPTPPRKIKKAAPDDLVVLRGCLARLGEIKHPLYQAAKAKRELGMDLDHAAIEEVVAELKDAVGLLVGTIKEMDAR